MSGRRPSNLRSLDAVLRRVRAAGRLDDGMGEAFATAARVCAIEVDASVAPGSDVPSYARGRVLGPYLRALESLDAHVRPMLETDPWAEFLAHPEWQDYLSAADPDATAARALAELQAAEARADTNADAATAQVLAEWQPGDKFPIVDDSGTALD